MTIHDLMIQLPGHTSVAVTTRDTADPYTKYQSKAMVTDLIFIAALASPPTPPAHKPSQLPIYRQHKLPADSPLAKTKHAGNIGFFELERTLILQLPTRRRSGWRDGTRIHGRSQRRAYQQRRSVIRVLEADSADDCGLSFRLRGCPSVRGRHRPPHEGTSQSEKSCSEGGRSRGAYPRP